jgi:hypothetical protein
MSKKFRIDFRGSITLSPEEIWTSGIPDNPEVQDVIERMLIEGSKENLIANWDLAQEIEIEVTNPSAFSGDDGDQPQKLEFDE